MSISRLLTGSLLVLTLTAADKIPSTPAQTWQGWGMALAWQAHSVYGSPDMAPKLPDPAQQASFMDLLYGDPAHSLGLNIARYNIGGGENPDAAHCARPGLPGLHKEARMEGFLSGPGGSYDWSRDASQRRMLQAAKARGADLFEAFSNSAPWWMTASGCVAGAVQKGQNNLRAEAVPAFAEYLATVARHFSTAEGIRFASISPLNEPDNPNWFVGNTQEGSSADAPRQEAVLIAQEWALRGTGILVAGTETSNFDHMTAELHQMSPKALAALGRVNVHQYGGSDPAALRRAVAGKPLWVSEIGCCITQRPAGFDGLDIARYIQVAMRDMGAQAWCFWQTDWGVISLADGHPTPLKQYYAIAQFSRFIRPGYVVLGGTGPNLVAAVSPDRRRVVVVVVNAGAPAASDIDVSAVAKAGASVAVYRTTADPAINLVPSQTTITQSGHVTEQLPGQSITTYAIG